METDIEKINNKGTGLLDTPLDDRDFEFGAVYTLPKPEELPPDFLLEPVIAKNQFDTDMCTAFAASAVSERQERVSLSPEYQFAKIKELRGEWEGWGSDLRTPMKSLVKKGSLPLVSVPEKLKLTRSNRDEIANWENWPEGIDVAAQKYRKESYFKVTGPYDVFDNLRCTIWKNRDEKRAILTGTIWNDNWSREKIIKEKGQPLFGHAIVVIGWTTIDGEVYLTIQNSMGENFGDRGMQYFSRDIVNEFFVHPAFTVKDIPPEDVEYYSSIGAKADENWIISLLKAFYLWPRQAQQ